MSRIELIPFSSWQRIISVPHSIFLSEPSVTWSRAACRKCLQHPCHELHKSPSLANFHVPSTCLLIWNSPEDSSLVLIATLCIYFNCDTLELNSKETSQPGCCEQLWVVNCPWSIWHRSSCSMCYSNSWHKSTWQHAWLSFMATIKQAS